MGTVGWEGHEVVAISATSRGSSVKSKGFVAGAGVHVCVCMCVCACVCVYVCGVCGVHVSQTAYM